MSLKISTAGIKLIKSFEGCSLKAYRCPAGVWTIGWGTTEPVNGVAIHEGMTITQEQADGLLLNNLKKYEDAVNKYTIVTLNQYQFDAMVSFTYNCGTGAYQKSDMLKDINKGDFNNAMVELLKWNKGGGKVLPGLTKRREAEKKLFLTVIEDVDLIAAINKIIKSGIKIDFNSWKSKDVMILKNVGALIVRLGGVEELVKRGIITQRTIWDKGSYTADNVRSLLIKYAATL